MCQYSSPFSNFLCHLAARSSQATLEQVTQKSNCPLLAPRENGVCWLSSPPEGWQLSPALPWLCWVHWCVPPGVSHGLGRAGGAGRWQLEAGSALGHHSCSAGECVTACSIELGVSFKNSAVKKYGVAGIAGFPFIGSSFCCHLPHGKRLVSSSP